MGLWATFIVMSHFSIPYIALVVGGVIGTTGRMVAPACDPKIGMVAALCAFVAIVGARSVGWTFYIEQREEKLVDEGMVYTLNEMFKEELGIAQRIRQTPDDTGMKQRVLEWVYFEDEWSEYRDPIDSKWNVQEPGDVTTALLADFKREIVPGLEKLTERAASEVQEEYIASFQETDEVVEETEQSETPVVFKLIIGILYGNLGPILLLTLIGGPYVAYNAAAYEM